ncbi:putative nuclear mRNA splicing, via spliceosome-related protein [Kockovaella imperatae]|uniref:Putative nuclear mRNA splicing, via spliceosome-related protein n=1 Tax=Kockovaella imperatae TaxID=4999 RepID=A0A1Y1UPD2_9TREE|nr:putative nuclear mRNA splicing, via spliceosome-related protein [Kockovaella imperatae]ORX39326.1 putative nuclear mRNA splicing, via spliceosome-related protein [Kockovaella imperatae]
MAPSRGTTENLEYPTKQIQLLDAHTGPVNVVKYNNGAKYCLSGSRDRSIRLWNPSAGKEIKCYQGHAQEVLALDIAHDNAKFASCGGDKMVFVWDVAAGTIIRRLQGHFGKINAVAFNQDSQVLASGGFDAKVMLWDMRAVSRDPIQTLKEATSSITSLTIPAKIPEIITGSLDGCIRSYDLRMGKMTDDVVGAPVSSVTPSPTSPKDTLLVSSMDGKLRIFDRANGAVLQTFSGHKVGDMRSKAAWGYGEGLVMTGDEEGRLWAYSVLDAKPIESSPKPIHKRGITWIESKPNGKEMITAGNDGMIKVWAKPDTA